MAQPTSQAQKVFRWSGPNVAHVHLMGRQSGYNPEITSCGIGTTCDSACGNGFVACNASTNLALFCYSPNDGQTCCNNGDGRACDAGYYCARDASSKTWCCETQYNLSQCASIYQVSTLLTGPPSISTMSSTTSSDLSSLLTTSSAVSTTLTPAAITQQNISATLNPTGNFNATMSAIPTQVPFSEATALHGVSLKTVVVLGMLVCQFWGF